MKRELHGITISQNHQTGMINATELIKNFNGINGLVNTTSRCKIELVDFKQEKRLDVYLKTQQTKEFFEELAKSEGCLVSDLIISKRGKNGGTWVHPLIFVDICMWLSQAFKVAALKMVYDNLLSLRDQSGDEYKTLCSALDKAGIAKERFDYVKVAKTISKHVLGTSKNGCWDDANEVQLDKRKSIETFLSKAIDEGFITTMSSVLSIIENQ
ncbi:MAG: KilA-N domain-containing protein [Thiotrichaceae bacterium]|nr:KilA-N domain-containing protein [Thiotrichaceae bacterium]